MSDICRMLHPLPVLNFIKWSAFIAVCLLLSMASLIFREIRINLWWQPIAIYAALMIGPNLLRLLIMARCEKMGVNLFAASEQKGFKALVARWVVE